MISIRGVLSRYGFSFDWNAGEKKAIALSDGGHSASIQSGNDILVLNGREIKWVEQHS
jgi:hypothetical protein